MTKQERAIKARAHYEDIKTRLAANTKLSIERTYVYSPDSFTQHESNLYPILLAFDGTYYAWNRQRLNKALYLYSNKRKQIAEENGVENLVAGAWGCGVFMQDPYTVAALLIGAARDYNIPNIYFAIPDRNSQNFESR